MTFKELLRTVYGLVMGTSVQYLKPKRHFFWPTGTRRIDDKFDLFLGGSGICGVLREGDRAFLINTNQAGAAREFEAFTRSLGVARVEIVVNTSLYPDFTGGNQLYRGARILVPPVDADFLLRQLGERPATLEMVGEERVVEFAGEALRLIPVGRASSPSDMVVWLESRRILFTGGLFYNRVHPPLRGGLQLDVQGWSAALEALLTRFQPALVVPGEGDPGSIEDVRDFIAYLNALCDPSVEFQDCRRRFDWLEIPSYTSLEENFDLVRGRVKTHTTL